MAPIGGTVTVPPPDPPPDPPPPHAVAPAAKTRTKFLSDRVFMTKELPLSNVLPNGAPEANCRQVTLTNADRLAAKHRA